MSRPAELHRQAMALVDEALKTRGQRDSSVLGLLKRAWRLEEEAATIFLEEKDFEPSRSILFRSAAALALDCGETESAVKLADEGLRGRPPALIRSELTDLRDRARIVARYAQAKGPLNPIRVVDGVIDEYKDYLRTEFRARDPKLREALERELNSAGFLAQEPFFQAHRPFKAGRRWKDLGLDGKLARALEERSGSPTAFIHQSDALERLLGTDAGPLVVTTGTGSGKSECFLVPVLQNAIEDATRFKKSGITAILVYPMNALANDQEERIRSYLESSGHTYVKVARYDRSTKQEERARLRQSPPHILLTNYMMLEYLLVRPADREELFANHRCRYFVLDEVHAYRGALGANIALLTRRVTAHLAVSRQDWNVDDRSDKSRFPQLVHVGTSATIKSVDETGRTPEEVHKLRAEAVGGFFSTLTGVEAAQVRVIGETLSDFERPPEAAWPEQSMDIRPPPPGDLAAVQLALADLGGSPEATPLEKAGRKAAILWDLNEMLARRPLSVGQIVERLQEEVPARRGVDAKEIRREVELALVLGAALPDGVPGALRLRTHRIVRGGWNFHRCVDPKCGRLYPMGQELCSCGRKTAPLYLCRACGSDTLRFSGDKDPEAAPLEPSSDRRASVVEWLRYDLDRIDELLDDEDEPLDTDRQMKARQVVRGSFDPETLNFSLEEGTYSVRCALAPARTTCLVCGGTAGSKAVLTPVSLGTSAAVRVLAEGLLEGLAAEHRSATPDPDRKERLLIFADSRQDAAHQARFVTYAGRYDRTRRRLVELLKEKGPLTIDKAVREMMALGVQRHDNPRTENYGDETYLSDQVREKAIAWEEAPLLDDIAITSSFRASVLNLGLVGVRYQHLDRYIAEKGQLLAARWGITPAQLSFVARCLLDDMRSRGALSRRMLAYHPSNPNCPDAFGAPADWERRLKQPAGYACDEDGHPVPFLDRTEVPWGMVTQSFWRRPKAGGRGPGIERRFRRLLQRMTNAELELKADDLLELITLLMEGPHHVIATDLYGLRKSRRLLQVNADTVQLELVRPEDRRRCSICNVRMPWVPEGTPCPVCKGRLQAWPDEEVTANRYVDRILDSELIPLVAGEHTAQIAAEERAELEESFKAPASESPINVIACSPTLEMGIDVGGLDAVVLRNIPPRPDNYAQRGGRAGRRTRVGIVVGYARNTPHDGYFYDKPQEMIAGEIPAPSIGLGHRDVMLRHLNAIVFGAAEPGIAGKMADYLDIRGNLQTEAISALISGVEAKFDHAMDVAERAWPATLRGAAGLGTRDEMRAALATLPDNIRSLFDRVRRQILELEVTIQNWQAMGTGDRRAINAMELKRRLLGLRSERTDTVEADDRTGGHPMRRFAEFGLLPGYEFPSEPCTVRLLGDRHEEEPISVERRYGIAQYQPEARAHARGHRWRVVGLDLTSPWNPKTTDPDWVYAVCATCFLRYGVQEHVRCPRCRSEEKLADALPGHGFGGFLAIRDDTPVLEEEERFSTASLVQVHPQHDGLPMFRYRLQTSWPAEVRRNETIWWVNEWKADGETALDAPKLHDQSRGFYLCPDCGRVLNWVSPEEPKKGTRRKPAKAKDDPYGHGSNCPRAGTPPKPCAIVCRGSATTLRIFVDLPAEWTDEDYNRWGYSLGYSLRIGIRHLYMLDGPEVDFSLEPTWNVREGARIRRRGALTFLDPAIGGSGFLDRAGAEMHLVARRALDHLDHKDCVTACYRCLKAYNNQRHHNWLSWPTILPDLEQLAEAGPVKTGEEVFDPGPWLEAYDAGVGSPLELQFLRVFERHGIAVEKQVPVASDIDGPPISIADFVIRSSRTAIYIDGASFHRGGRLRRDRMIREALVGGTAGWRVVSFSKEALGHPESIVASVK